MEGELVPGRRQSREDRIGVKNGNWDEMVDFGTRQDGKSMAESWRYTGVLGEHGEHLLGVWVLA